MRAYTVHAPPGDAAPERFAFIKDGISWPALFVPVLWILWQRLWLVLIGYLIYVLLLMWTELLFNENAATLLAILGAILFALSANDIRRVALSRRGWREIGGSFGANLDEAEVRFFQTWKAEPASPAPAEPGKTMARAPYREPIRHDRSDEPIFGLFPEPER